MKHKIRLFVEQKLAASELIELNKNQSHYLSHVMRRKIGDKLNIFNGADGEFEAEILTQNKKITKIKINLLLKTQQQLLNLQLFFAPLKFGKIDNLIAQATELGVTQILPVITDHTIGGKLNLERARLNAIEAAEQCERMDVPEIQNSAKFSQIFQNLPENLIIIYADETGKGFQPSELFAKITAEFSADIKNKKIAVLVGPEGGFSASELETLRAKKNAYAMTLGPRILKAQTAATSALTLVAAEFGDWDEKPSFRS